MGQSGWVPSCEQRAVARDIHLQHTVGSNRTADVTNKYIGCRVYRRRSVGQVKVTCFETGAAYLVTVFSIGDRHIGPFCVPDTREEIGIQLHAADSKMQLRVDDGSVRPKGPNRQSVVFFASLGGPTSVV